MKKLISAMATPPCPCCGSKRAYKNGLRYLLDSRIAQRWLCKDCGYRFSEKKIRKVKLLPQENLQKRLNSFNGILKSSQLWTVKEEAKKLNTATETKTVAGESLQQENKGKIIEFVWWMKKQGYRDGTILSRTKLLKIMVKRGANLYDPETVKDVIAKQSWSEGRKENAVNAYTTFLKMTGGTWNPPIYSRIQKLPFIPREEEIDALIASCAQKGATLLQTLKETAARAGEAWALKWTDLDVENRTIKLTPEKGSNPRMFKITPKLLSMLLAMPRKSDFIFGSYPLRG
jgi:integrase